MCCGTWEPRRRHKLADKESKVDNSKERDSKVRDREIRDREIRVDRSTMNRSDTTGNRQSTTKKESTKSGITGSLPVSEVIQKEIDLRKQNFKVAVMAELINELTVDIY